MPEHPRKIEIDATEGREERAHRRALLQEVNDRIDALGDHRSNGVTLLVVLCECGAAGCVERVHISRETYEDLRRSPERFVVSAGHESVLEHAVWRQDGVVIAQGRSATDGARGDSR